MRSLSIRSSHPAYIISDSSATTSTPGSRSFRELGAKHALLVRLSYVQVFRLSIKDHREASGDPQFQQLEADPQLQDPVVRCVVGDFCLTHGFCAGRCTGFKLEDSLTAGRCCVLEVKLFRPYNPDPSSKRLNRIRTYPLVRMLMGTSA